MPWGLTPAHLIIVMVIVLIVVGPGKLPETGAAIGKAIRGFKDAVDTGDAGKDSTAAQQPMQAQQPYPVGTACPIETGAGAALVDVPA